MRTLDDLKEEMMAVAAGTLAKPRLFRDEAAARRVLLANPHMRQLLQIIAREKPESVTALALAAGRAQPNVTRAMDDLIAAGLVGLEPNGRARRPVLLVTEIHATQYYDLTDPSADRIIMTETVGSATAG